MGWVENIVGKGENASYQHFLLFQQCFQKVSFSQSWLCGLELNTLDRTWLMYKMSFALDIFACCKICVSLTLSQTSPGFYMSAVQVFLKTLWEKEKLLIMNNFSFSHSVFYPFRQLSAIFIIFEIVVCKLFQFRKSLKFVVWERVK